MNRGGAPVLIMAGGTGGHIFPGLALAEALEIAGVPVQWLGAAGAMECRRVPAAGIELATIRISGVRRKGLGGWLALPFRLLRAVGDAVGVMRRVRPRCGVSFGGYAAGPGGLACRLLRIPLIVHEQNRVPGLTNRILARMATRVFEAFPGSFPRALNPEVSGNPVRDSVVALPPPEERFGGRTGRPQLLVTGGSQGAASLNRLVPAALAELPAASRPSVLHQAGRGHAGAVRSAYDEAGVTAEVVEFIEDMAAAYGAADLAVCRAGALTVSELAVAGLGAVLVPYPHAVDDHQTRNAAVLADAGGAIVLQESALDAPSLGTALGPLLADRGRLLGMARAAARVGIRDAARRMADACLAVTARNAGEAPA